MPPIRIAPTFARTWLRVDVFPLLVAAPLGVTLGAISIIHSLRFTRAGEMALDADGRGPAQQHYKPGFVPQGTRLA